MVDRIGVKSRCESSLSIFHLRFDSRRNHDSRHNFRHRCSVTLIVAGSDSAFTSVRIRQEKPDSIMIHLRRMTGHDEFLSASILCLHASSKLDASIVSLMTGDQRDLSVGRRLNVMFERRRYRVVRFVVVAAIDAHRFSALRFFVELSSNTLVGAWNLLGIFVRSICISRGAAKHRRRRCGVTRRRRFARASTTIHQVARGSNSKALARATLRNSSEPILSFLSQHSIPDLLACPVHALLLVRFDLPTAILPSIFPV